MLNIIIRKYSAGVAEVWYDKEHICDIGTTRISEGKYGKDYERELQRITKICALLGCCVKCLNYEENIAYEKEINMKIESAALKNNDGRIFTGRSHAICYQVMKDAGVECGRNCTQGFITDTGIFVDRYKAAEIAHRAGQTKKLESPLFSEDLTGDWPWKKRNQEGQK